MDGVDEGMEVVGSRVALKFGEVVLGCSASIDPPASGALVGSGRLGCVVPHLYERLSVTICALQWKSGIG
jgi:hypothetical protein